MLSLLKAGIVPIAICGGFLYFGGRFIGLLLLCVSLVLWLVHRGVRDGWKSLPPLVEKIFRKVRNPALGILLALLLGGVLMVFTGYSPLVSYRALFYGGLIKNWHISVLNATPLIFTGLSISLAFKGGLFNIGAEGQYYAGAMMATWLGILLNLPPLIVIPLIYIFGGCAGAACNMIPALLKVKTGAHEVVTTMMFAYIARTLSSLFIRMNGGDPVTSRHPYITDTIQDSAWLLRFSSFLDGVNYRLHIGILIAVATALLVHYILERTRLGFEIRAVGFNSRAAKTQGIATGRIIVITLLLSGVLAAFSGVTQILGLDHKMAENLNAGYGWNGIAVALLAGTSPVGVIFTALLWGVLDAGGQYMARTLQTPNAVVEIIKGMILFFLLARHLFVAFRRRRRR